MKEYRLRHKKTNEYLKVRTESNSEGDFCCEDQHILETDKYNNRVWIAKSPEHAEWVRHNSTRWYNADYETPSHDFKADELEVMSVDITIAEERIEVTLPTKLEYYQIKIKKDKDYRQIIQDYIDECERKQIDMSKDYCDYYHLDEYNLLKEKYNAC